MDRLNGKRALITGAGQGLGAAIAAMFVREGAHVLLTDIQAENAAARAAELGPNAFALPHDVREEAAWNAAMAQAKERMGGLDVLVNNAGIGGIFADVEHTPPDIWRQVHAVNLDGVYLGCRAAIPLMRETSRMGSIINISSIAGIIADARMAAYNSSKAAVLHLTKSVALAGARMNPQIRCNSVHPVFIDTPILDPWRNMFGKEEGEAKLAKGIPMGRLGEPDDVAYMVTYLASDESKFVTGSEFKIDGGISAQ